jgi:hypothetical protein
MRCELVQSDEMDNWFTIERLEHAGRHWMEPVGENGMKLMMSARPSDACIEGTAFEMRAIAIAINKGECARFKRCAAVFINLHDSQFMESGAGEHYSLYSPRNSTIVARLTIEEAKELAADIIGKLDKLGTGQ